MLPHLDQVTSFASDLVALLPSRAINHPWPELMAIRSSHNQSLQLEELLEKLSVLDLHKQVESLGLDSNTPIKVCLKELRALLTSSAPVIGDAR